MTRWILVVCIGLVAPGLSFAPCAAQGARGTVVVRVRSGRDPVAEAAVRGDSARAVTDASGVATLTLPIGPGRITVERVGFAAESLWVTADAGRRIEVSVALRELAEALDEVVVSATRNERRVADEPTRVEVTGREDIDEHVVAAPGNIAELLGEASGVRVQSSAAGLGGASVRIRGMSGRYTQILSDGLPLLGLHPEALGPLQTSPLDLQRVELISGVASALYGPTALGGVVNLVSRRPDDARELLASQSSLDGTDAVLWSARRFDERWGATLVAGGHRQFLDDHDHDGWAEIAGYRRGAVRPRLFWNGTGGGSLLATAGVTAEDRRGGTVGGATLADGMPHRLAADTRRADAGLVGRFPLASGTSLSLRGSATGQWATRTVSGPRAHERRDSYFEETGITIPHGTQLLVLGAALEHDGYHVRERPSLEFAATTPGVYAQHSWFPAHAFALTSSARLDVPSGGGASVSPRVSALLRFLRDWSLRLSAGGGTLAPTPFTEQTDDIDPARIHPLARLRSERARSGALDLGGAIGRLELNGSLHASVIEHPITLRAMSGAPGDVEWANAAGPTRTHGAELYARYRREPIELIGSFAWLRGTERDVETGTRRETPLEPRHAAGLAAIWEEDESGARVGLEGYYTGRQSLADDPYRSISRPYLLLDGVVEVPVARALLFVNGENLTDVRQSRFDPLLLATPGPGGRWTTDAWAPLAGRTINVGVRARL